MSDWNTDLLAAPRDGNFCQVTVEFRADRRPTRRQTAVGYRDKKYAWRYPNGAAIDAMGGRVIAWAPLLEPYAEEAAS